MQQLEGGARAAARPRRRRRAGSRGSPTSRTPPGSASRRTPTRRASAMSRAASSPSGARRPACSSRKASSTFWIRSRKSAGSHEVHAGLVTRESQWADASAPADTQVGMDDRRMIQGRGRSMRERIEDGERSFSFEFFPPKDGGRRGAALAGDHASWSPYQPTFVSVTYGAGGTTRDTTVPITGRIARETSLVPDGPPHLRRAHPRGARRHPGQLRPRPASATCSPCAATRGGPRADWTPTLGGLTYASELVELATRWASSRSAWRRSRWATRRPSPSSTTPGCCWPRQRAPSSRSPRWSSGRRLRRPRRARPGRGGLRHPDPARASCRSSTCARSPGWPSCRAPSCPTRWSPASTPHEDDRPTSAAGRPDRHRALRAGAGAGRARPALLHAQPVAGDAGDLRGAAHHGLRHRGSFAPCAPSPSPARVRPRGPRHRRRPRR